MGFPRPVHLPSFLTLGRIDNRKVVDRNQAGILFLAWRCIYAEIIKGRADNVPPNARAAYLRTLLLLHTRLTNYGESWLLWVRKNRNTKNKSYIPRKHQNKMVILQDENGNYEINQDIYAEIDRLRA